MCQPQGWYMVGLYQLINFSVTTDTSWISGQLRPSHQANFVCFTLRYVLCQHVRYYHRPTFRRNFQTVLQTVLQVVHQAILQAILQAEPVIKYHALSTSISNITGYNFILLPDIYISYTECACSMSFDTSQ